MAPAAIRKMLVPRPRQGHRLCSVDGGDLPTPRREFPATLEPKPENSRSPLTDKPLLLLLGNTALAPPLQSKRDQNRDQEPEESKHRATRARPSGRPVASSRMDRPGSRQRPARCFKVLRRLAHLPNLGVDHHSRSEDDRTADRRSRIGQSVQREVPSAGRCRPGLSVRTRNVMRGDSASGGNDWRPLAVATVPASGSEAGMDATCASATSASRSKRQRARLPSCGPREHNLGPDGKDDHV